MLIASISGGKDSTAMMLSLAERGMPFRAVFMDTGWEHPKTYEYLENVIEPLVKKLAGESLIRLKAQRTMVELIRFKRMFPSRLRRYCTEELKVFPLRDYVASLDEDVINAVGIRWQESKARSTLPEREWSDVIDCEVWRPILSWSVADVVAIHARHGVLPNPLYLEGASRVGCWPCIFARKSEVRQVAETDPARIDLIEMLEAELTRKADREHLKKNLGLPMEKRSVCSSSSSRTFFTWKDHWHKDPRAPIRQFVEWASTSRGGKEREDFDPDALAREGCMRWGLCATEPEEPQT